MTSKSKRFIKRTVLLLMLLTCGMNAYGGRVYICDQTQGGFTYSFYEETDESGLSPTQYFAYLVSIDTNAENIVVPSFRWCTCEDAHMTAQYEVWGFLGTIKSSNLKTIHFQNNAGFQLFDCENLTDIYFEGKTPEMNESFSYYFRSPNGSQITVHLSDKTPEQIVELRTQTGWSNFHKIVKIGEENQKHTVHLQTEHARVKVGNNTYTSNQELEVDKYSDLTIDVDKFPTADYQVTSVKLNGREILGDMTYVSGSNNNGHYTYTILGVINDAYLEVKAENLYNSASVICSNGGKWRREGSSSSYNLPNGSYPVRWLKSEEAPNILIVPDEGCTLDRIYSNSNDVTGSAHDNGNGTFSYKLTANANVSVTFKEMPATTTWNVITLGGADITATFKNKRGEELAYTLSNGENAVPDDAQSMTMRIDAEEGKTLVVTADGVDLSSYFRFDEEWTGEYDDELNPINEYYYHTTTPIPANKLKAKNWTIGVKDSDSQAITWVLQAKGDLPETWSASIYLDGQSPLLSISNQNPSASASNASPSGELLKVAINGGDGYVFNLTLNGQTVISSSHCINGEFETEDQDFITPLLTNGTWAVEFSQKPADVIHFADAEVRRICLINWDTDRDGQLSKAEAAAVTTLKKDENPLFQSNKDITSFDELQYFTGLNSIEEGCFAECEHLQSIVLPSSIQSIGNSAFSGCKALSGISLPEGVRTIGDYAFSVTNIETFYLPKNVTEIGMGILSWNDKLVSIAVSPENQTFDSRKGCNAIIRKSDLFLMAGCANTVIPEDVKYLFRSAFEGIRSLTEIVLPAGLQSVGQDVFRYCSALTSVIAKMETPVDVYPNELGETSFTGISDECVLTVPACKTDAYIAAGWTIKETNNEGLFLRIEEAQPVVDDDIIVFADANVKAICVANWDTNHDGELSKAEAEAVTTLKVNSNSVFKGNETITSFDEFQYFTGLARIENSAFNGCKSLKSIIMPKQAQQIETVAFSGCEQLESALLPESLTLIDHYAFQNCKALTSIIVPEGVVSLGEQCFLGCIQLKSIALPESLKTIHKNAFRRCISLQQLFIPKNVESIGTYNAGGNSNLVSLAVDKNNTVYESPEGCNAIIEKATGKLVMGCNTTRIPSSVKKLEAGSMYNLISIRKIEIPANVDSLGALALADCFYVTSVVAKGETPPTLDNDALRSIGSNCVLTVPYGKTKAYRDAGWGDGQEDSPAIFKAIVEDKSQYDVNRDGEMNITDVTTLVNKILGK